MARILIADDSLMSRQIISKIATDLGHKVVGESDNGLDTLSKYIELSPDIVTLDITMPVMDGMDCLKKLISYDNKVKVLIISAIGKRSMVLEALKTGAKYYTTKPLDERMVADAIRITLEDDNPPPDPQAFNQ